MPTEQSDIRPSLLSRFIATGFFSGYIPWASGTFGTLVGAMFFLLRVYKNRRLFRMQLLFA
jgi:phosphatidylglycerophosphatase A